MFDFLLRLIVSTIKLALQVFMILGGVVMASLGKAALATLSEADAENAEVGTPIDSPDAAFTNGDVDIFELRAIHNRYHDTYGD